MKKKAPGMTHMELKKNLLLFLARVQYLYSRSVPHSRRHGARTDRISRQFSVSRSNAADRWDY
jgi:hypothetical protein